MLVQARAHGLDVVVPTPVLVEWWRGREPDGWRLRHELVLEPLDAQLAFVAGEALALVGPGPSAVDAVVMASAARRGDMVLTSDPDDLERLRAVFPAVRVLRV